MLASNAMLGIAARPARTAIRALTALAWLGSVAAFAVSCEPSRTYALVTVDTDQRANVVSMSVTASLGSIVTNDASITTFPTAGSNGRIVFPASFGVLPGSGAEDGEVTIRVALYFNSPVSSGPNVIATRTVRFRFLPNLETQVRVFVPFACTAMVAPPATCGAGTSCTVSEYCERLSPPETCGDNGSCVSPDVSPQLIDGGMTDASADHVEACVPSCVSRLCGGDGCGGSCGACTGGTVCGTMGTCVACTAGAACDPGAVCTAGRTDCSGTMPRCLATGLEPVGTRCANGVCNATGHCVACNAGASCDSGNACTTGAIDCSSGGPACVTRSVAPVGTSCPGGTCDGAGNCVTCTAGGACTPSADCKTGTLSCPSGQPATCTISGDAPNGTPCQGGTCDGSGNCVTCVAGGPCATGNPCTTGTIACPSGSCVASNNAAGSACPGGTCDGSGNCMTCTSGGSCSTGNPCTTGTITCPGSTCTASGNVAAGTACGSGMACDGAGACVACTQGATCTINDCVATASIDCSSGSAVCTPITYVPMGTLCFSGVYDQSRCDGAGNCNCGSRGVCLTCGLCGACPGQCP